jgi:hypothetical protein
MTGRGLNFMERSRLLYDGANDSGNWQGKEKGGGFA